MSHSSGLQSGYRSRGTGPADLVAAGPIIGSETNHRNKD